MLATPTLFGASYSVYVRIVRLSLLEKGVPHELVPIDVFAEGGPPADYLARHPFGRIPSFEHAGFSLYETTAITRYVDEAFEGPGLQPTGVRDRARCNQLISIADNYAYPHLVWGVYVEQVSKPQRGEQPDAARVASSLAVARPCLGAMDDLIGGQPWFAGESLSLADLHIAPMFAYFLQAADGRELLAKHPRLARWWSQIRDRSSMRQSAPEEPVRAR